MTIEEFWNAAFLAALHRVGPKQAKKEANEATDLCIQHWQVNMERLGMSHPPKWKDQNVTFVPLSGDEYRRLLRENGDPRGK